MNINSQIRDEFAQLKNFTSVESLEEFINSEHEFWKTKCDELKRTIHGSKDKLQQAINHFPQLKNQLDNGNEQQLQVKIDDFITKHLNMQIIFSDSPGAVAIIKAYGRNEDTGNNFYNYVKKNIIAPIARKNQLIGFLLGYEFEEQGESGITKRRGIEQESFEQLRGSLAIKKDELITQVADFQKDISNWRDKTTEEYGEWYKERKQEMDGLVKEKSNKFDQFHNESEQKIEELKKLYTENIRWEGPAKYWKQTAKDLKEQGKRWTKWMAGVIGVGVIGLATLYFCWALGKHIPAAFDMKYIQGVILLMTIISLVVYLVRVFSRLAFSSFHLQRDAEEREQLVTLYLSLVNDNKIDEKSRDIVLQALFSRSETGLLSKEHGPTMPTSGIQDLIQRMSKS